MVSPGGAAIKACHVSGWQVGGGRSAIAVVAFWLLVREARRVPSPRELLVACAYGACLVSFVLANKLTTAADKAAAAKLAVDAAAEAKQAAARAAADKADFDKTGNAQASVQAK